MELSNSRLIIRGLGYTSHKVTHMFLKRQNFRGETTAKKIERNRHE